MLLFIGHVFTKVGDVDGTPAVGHGKLRQQSHSRPFTSLVNVNCRLCTVADSVDEILDNKEVPAFMPGFFLLLRRIFVALRQQAVKVG